MYKAIAGYTTPVYLIFYCLKATLFMFDSPIAQILAITLIAVPMLYLFYCLIAGQWLSINPYRLLLNMSAAFLIMSIMEASLGHFHTHIFGWRLWEYHLLPNHRAYGTFLGLITWPWYGFHFYLFNKALKKRNRQVNNLFLHGCITGIDGPLLEILGNGLYLLVFGGYVFYYFPGEIGHLTSLYVIPYYAMAGIVLTIVMSALNQARIDYWLVAALYATASCFIMMG